MRFAAFVILATFCLLPNSSAGGAKEAVEELSRDRLAKTAELFFSADASYRSGDLLVRSQVADFQDYLRKTQGSSLATHSRLLRRIEPDNSRLARVFFSKGGRSTLRAAAQELGGYGPILRYCRTKRNLKNLKQFVKLGQVKQMVEKIAAKEALDTQRNKPKARAATSRFSRIYTLDQLLEAMLSPPSASTPAQAGSFE